MKRIENMVAIVTGGSKGIGKAIAKLYAEEGAKVLIVYHSDDASAQRTKEEIETAGGKVSIFKGDVSVKTDMEAMAEKAIGLYGRIDILCSNAGIFPLTPISDITEKEWDDVQSVNLKGTFLALKACLSQMRKQQYGKVVVISSVTGPRVGIPGFSHYAASKGGLLGFVNNACIELAYDNITINAVEPGSILTEGAKEVLSDEDMKGIAESIPLKRMADPREVAFAALFLSTEESSYITGQSIMVDGGMLRTEWPLPLMERILNLTN